MSPIARRLDDGDILHKGGRYQVVQPLFSKGSVGVQLGAGNMDLEFSNTN